MMSCPSGCIFSVTSTSVTVRWIIDVAIMITLLLIGYNIFKTIRKRTERKLYASTWYVMGTFLSFPIVYFIGNVMWHPDTGSLQGAVDGVFNWFYGHNVLGLWFTTLGIAGWYYFIPIMTRRPLYSHLLSMIGFFSIVFVYTGVGGHHLLQAPIPEWLKTIAIVNSGLMMIPVLAFITNILLTMRGRWDCFIESIPLRFILIGAFLYFLASAQGTFQAFRETNMYLHFGQWAVGHAHIALLGGFGFLVMGAIYFLISRITGKEIYSKRLMSYHFWFTMLGFILFFSIMTMFFITVILPYLLMDYPPSDISHPYSDEQGRGREIYKSNGCLYCHSQFVRPQDWGLGRTSLPGDYFYDRPHLFGTERTGPDLAQIGGQRPPLWEIMHHRNPRSVSPGSIMPPDISWKNSFFPALPALPWSLRHWPGTLCAAC